MALLSLADCCLHRSRTSTRLTSPFGCSYEEDLGAALAILADQGAKFDKASGAWWP